MSTELPEYLSTPTAWFCTPGIGEHDIPMLRQESMSCAKLVRFLEEGARTLLPRKCYAVYFGQEEDPHVQALKQVCKNLDIKCEPVRLTRQDNRLSLGLEWYIITLAKSDGSLWVHLAEESKQAPDYDTLLVREADGYRAQAYSDSRIPDLLLWAAWKEFCDNGLPMKNNS